MLIQIIDDHPGNLALLEQLVRAVLPGLTPESHLEPARALEACGARMPDLIMVDFLMPGMNGLEFVKEFRRLPGSADVLILMVTASTERRIRQQALDLGITDFLNKPIDPSEFKARLKNLVALRQAHLHLTDQNKWLEEAVAQATRVIHEREEELIHRLAIAAECRDHEMGGHIARMARYSLLVAQGLGLSPQRCDLILKAAPMHDLGKLGIPDAILHKSGPLDEGERAVMRTHPVIGHGILKGSASKLICLGAQIAVSHHERWDGSGYPHGLAGEHIPGAGRIIAVADVFDALTTERSYKPAWSVDQACEHLVRESGRHFDPRCVEAFLLARDEIKAIRAEFEENVTDLPFPAHPILPSGAWSPGPAQSRPGAEEFDTRQREG